LGLRVSGASVVLGATEVVGDVDDVDDATEVDGASVTSGDADWEHEINASARTKPRMRMS
jgi:uncharacterized protein (UPF0212 family)